jgi:hypothetical protein
VAADTHGPLGTAGVADAGVSVSEPHAARSRPHVAAQAATIDERVRMDTDRWRDTG